MVLKCMILISLLSVVVSYRTGFRLKWSRGVLRHCTSGSDTPSTEDVNDGDMTTESEEFAEVLDSIVTEEGGKNETENAVVEAEPSPLEMAIKEREEELAKKLSDLEGKLRTERVSTMKTKDKLSESGKTGFFMVQAQVAEFLKKKDADQKGRVSKNKREFVSKILPVVDAFNAAPMDYPAETEREENMHKSFGSLVSSIMIVFEKYGVKEYSAEVGEKLDSSLHQVDRVVEGETDGISHEILRPGHKDSEGEVIRRALVVAVKKQPEATKDMDDNEEEEEVGDEKEGDEEAEVEEAEPEEVESEI